jgi:hypothetical protein
MAGGRGVGARPAAPVRMGGVPAGRPAGIARPGATMVRPAGTIGARGSNRVVFFSGGFPRGRFVHNHNHFRFRQNCFNGFPCNNGFFLNSGLLFPFGFSDPFYGNYYSQPAPPTEVVSSDSSNSANMQLALEVQRLADEVELMRDRERQAVAPRPQQQGSLSAQAPAESTAFVFRDGHRITTQNYAIVGDTLWVLGEHTSKKVSLANLDKTATEQANAANGIELHLP